MNIKEALDYIHSVKWQGSKPGLSRTQELLDALGNPEKDLRFVHVAGTNGKGSTCTYIASVMKAAGYTTGLYTSPYIMRFNERIQVNGTHISDEDLITLIEEIRPFADAMQDPPTEFEIITALAMKYFSLFGCDIVVMEVGLGGELDSTNVIDTPELAVITAIDYDHVDVLGPTLTDIARAKAGIIKAGGDVLIYGGNNEAEEVFKSAAAQRGARLHKAVFERITKASHSLDKTRLIIEPYEEILLPLAGVYQPNNALVAISAIEILREKGYNITVDNIIDGISHVSLPGRFEYLGYDPVFILDGAHNPHGTKAVAESLQAYFKNRKFIFIMGVLKDKDAQKMVEIIAPLAEHVFTVTPDSPRKTDAAALADIFRNSGVPATSCATVSEGVESALELANDTSTRTAGSLGAAARGIICATGSLYLSADIKRAYDRLEL